MSPFSSPGKGQRIIASSRGSSHRQSFMSITQATSWSLHIGRPPVLCLVQPELGHNRTLDPLSFAWASTWSQMTRERQVGAAMKQTVSWYQTTLQCFPLWFSENESKGRPYFIFLTKLMSQVVIERCFLISPGLLLSVTTSNRCYKINARYCHHQYRYKVSRRVMRLRQGNGGQGEMMDTNVKQTALLSQKTSFPQLKAHVQPRPATSQIYQVERTAKRERVDMILKENPNSFPINYVPRVSSFCTEIEFVGKTVAITLQSHCLRQTIRLTGLECIRGI